MAHTRFQNQECSDVALPVLTPLFVVCVASLLVVQPLDCWSDPMAGAEPTLWRSGASRRRQSVPDDLHISQSCPGRGDSEQRACEATCRGDTSATARSVSSSAGDCLDGECQPDEPEQASGEALDIL